MNSLLMMLLAAVFVQNGTRNRRLELPRALLEGLALTASLLIGWLIFKVIGFFGDVDFFGLPLSALAACASYGILNVKKTHSISASASLIVISVYLAVTAASFWETLVFGIGYTVLSAAIYAITQRTEVSVPKVLRGTPILLCAAGLIAMVLDGIK